MNIAEILKHCPKGMKLYSTIHGEVELVEVNNDNYYPIVVRDNKTTQTFTKEGKFVKEIGECTLFPNRLDRNWNTFVPPSTKHTFQPFEKVLMRDSDKEQWFCSYFSHATYGKYIAINGCDWMQCIPFKGNEHLVGTTEKPIN